MTTATRAPELNNGILTSWLPLTTTYPVVDNCSSAFFASGNAQTNVVYLYDPNQAEAQFTTHCLPDVATSWWDQSDTATITSLGPFVCPAAYTAAYSEIVDGSSTLTACCPSGFAYVSLCSPGDVGQCASVLPGGMTLSYVQPGPSSDGSFITTTAVLQSTQIVQGVQVNGYNFAGQVAATSTSTGSSSSSAPSQPTSTTSISPISASTSAPTTSPTKSSNSLSTGAIAGISIGVALSVIGAICLLGGILYVRRQRAKQRYTVTPTITTNVPAEMEGRGTIQEVYGGDVGPKSQTLSGAHEMDAN